MNLSYCLAVAMAITQTKLTSISVQYFQLFKCINAHYTNNNSLPYTCTAHTHTVISAGVSRRRVYRGLHLVKQNRNLTINLLSVFSHSILLGSPLRKIHFIQEYTTKPYRSFSCHPLGFTPIEHRFFDINFSKDSLNWQMLFLI